MTKLSVNVNKVATLRNSRGGRVPSVLAAVDACVRVGAPGITVHPRADRRHITPDDARAVAAALAGRTPHVEYNIEGDPRPELLEMVRALRPDQCTLVPVTPGELTSHVGWGPGPQSAGLPDVVRDLRARGVRVSLFVEPVEAAIRWAAEAGANRVELYTEPYARAFERGAEDGLASYETFAAAAQLAHELGLGVNAGHDLDLENLVLFRELPHLEEVSIGHALMSRALFEGLEKVVKEYLALLGGAAEAPV
jgi:pyridoxine 5-phosphate synthase